jgi:hypothetical protein
MSEWEKKLPWILTYTHYLSPLPPPPTSSFYFILYFAECYQVHYLGRSLYQMLGPEARHQ